MRKSLYNQNSCLRPTVVWLVFFLVAIVFGGCGKETPKEDLALINGRLEQLENKTVQLEAQFTETKESLTTLNESVTTLEEGLNALAQKIEKAPVPKEVLSQEKEQYHKVVRGDTLYGISRKYSLSVEELRQLNNLNINQAIKPGQKLLVTPSKN